MIQMADWVQNRVMVLGAADEVQPFFSFEDDSTSLLHLRPRGKIRRASKAKSDTKAPSGARKAGVVTVDELFAAKQAVQQLGGVDRALKLIEALERLKR